MPAVEVADLLIPYRPSAFDLSAIQTTAKLPPSSSSPPAAPMRRASVRRRASWSTVLVRRYLVFRTGEAPALTGIAMFLPRDRF